MCRYGVHGAVSAPSLSWAAHIIAFQSFTALAILAYAQLASTVEALLAHPVLTASELVSCLSSAHRTRTRAPSEALLAHLCSPRVKLRLVSTMFIARAQVLSVGHCSRTWCSQWVRLLLRIHRSASLISMQCCHDLPLSIPKIRVSWVLFYDRSGLLP